MKKNGDRKSHDTPVKFKSMALTCFCMICKVSSLCGAGDRGGDGAGGEHAPPGVVGQQLQDIWGPAGDHH